MPLCALRTTIVFVTSISTAFALSFSVLLTSPASAASSAATATVATWDELKAAFVVNGNSVALAADITAPAKESLVVRTGATVTLDLNGHSLTVTNPARDDASVQVPIGATLIINDSASSGGGTLIAHSGQFAAAGIGGNGRSSDHDGDGQGLSDAGAITINGGTVMATGGIYGGAGIGGGLYGHGGNVTITDGTITASGVGSGACIGSGGNEGGGSSSGSGTTTISGGITIATGGVGAAGIGGGQSINGSNGGTTTVSGGTVTATGGDFGAGIGGGYCYNNSEKQPDPFNCGGNGGTTTITGGTVAATGGYSAAGIGGGFDFAESGSHGGTTIISGGSITASGSSLGSEHSAPGIGGGFGGTPGVLIVIGKPDADAAIDGGAGSDDRGRWVSPITYSETAAGTVYSATTSVDSDGNGSIAIGFSYPDTHPNAPAVIVVLSVVAGLLLAALMYLALRRWAFPARAEH